MAKIIDISKLPKLIDNHFGNNLRILGYSLSESKTEGENYFIYKFAYTTQNREIDISVRNDFQILDYKIICAMVIRKLPEGEKYENRLYPENFQNILYKQPMEYDNYKIDQKKDIWEELNRVLTNYAQLIFTGNLLKVIQGELWFENIHPPRD